MLTNTQVREASGDAGLRQLIYENLKTGEVTEYRAPEGEGFGIFVFAGYEPATELVRGKVELNEQGYVETDRHQKTSVDGVYAAGDVCEKTLRQVVTAAGDGALAATELERYAAAMQEKTGLHPEILAAAVSVGDAAKTTSGTASSQSASPSSGVFTEDIRNQLIGVFGRMERPLVLKLYLDAQPVSGELRAYMEGMAELSEKISVEIQEAADGQETPCVRVFLADGTDTGLAFHGAPGGHEFTSFVLGLYNASGPGQAIDEEIEKRIRSIDHPVHMRIMVSLSCTMCPELVTAAQKVAASNPMVRAEVYDLNHFPEMKEKYNVMSVPCMVVNDENVTFGKKSIQQLLEMI